MIWSGWEAAVNGAQNLYIAELSDPHHVKGSRVRISMPEYPWEKIGDLKPRTASEANPADPANPIHVDVNEGPENPAPRRSPFSGSTEPAAAGPITIRSACWLPPRPATYSIRPPGKRVRRPCSGSPDAHAYGAGHNSFFQSPDGTQDWILYHANSEPGQGCGSHRAPRAQPFTWKPDGLPIRPARRSRCAHPRALRRKLR